MYVFFHKSTELDEEFWREEIQDNENAQVIKEKIYTNLGIGYSWSVKRTMGQPAIVSLYYGFIAIAIALLTDGIIYSSDGAWDSEYLPIEANKFKDDYLDLNKISDVIVKKNIDKWIKEMKN